jgi:hypothetical protein
VFHKFFVGGSLQHILRSQGCHFYNCRANFEALSWLSAASNLWLARNPVG